MSLGLSAVALVVLTLNIWITAHAGAYAWTVAGTEVANRQNKTPFLLGGLAIALVLACTGIYNDLIPFLNILRIFIPPIGGVLIGDFLFTFRRKLPRVEHVKFRILRIAPVAAYVIGTAVAWITNHFNLGIPPCSALRPPFSAFLWSMRFSEPSDTTICTRSAGMPTMSEFEGSEAHSLCALPAFPMNPESSAAAGGMTLRQAESSAADGSVL